MHYLVYLSVRACATRASQWISLLTFQEMLLHCIIICSPQVGSYVAKTYFHYNSRHGQSDVQFKPTLSEKLEFVARSQKSNRTVFKPVFEIAIKQFWTLVHQRTNYLGWLLQTWAMYICRALGGQLNDPPCMYVKAHTTCTINMHVRVCTDIHVL